MRRRRPSDETLVALRGRLEDLPARSPERLRLLHELRRPARRFDRHGLSGAARAIPAAIGCIGAIAGSPRKLPRQEMERFCELVAAMKLRTTNLKSRHLSTGRAIELLVEHGIETPDGLGAGATRFAHPHHGQPLSASLGLGRSSG